MGVENSSLKSSSEESIKDSKEDIKEFFGGKGKKKQH